MYQLHMQLVTGAVVDWRLHSLRKLQSFFNEVINGDLGHLSFELINDEDGQLRQFELRPNGCDGNGQTLYEVTLAA